MRDLLDRLDAITEATVNKYPAGTAFSVSDSQKGQELQALLDQQGFDYRDRIIKMDPTEFADLDQKVDKQITIGRGGEQFLFINPQNDMVLITSAPTYLNSALVHYKAAGGREAGGQLSNRGESAEGILGAAMFAKFAKRRGNEDIGTVSVQDIYDVLDGLRQTGQDMYQITVNDSDNVHADTINFLLKLKTNPYRDLMDAGKRELMARDFASAAAYVNSSDAERYSKYFYLNGRADEIGIIADGAASETEAKTDVWVAIRDPETGQARRLRLDTSLKVGGVTQFGQVGGNDREAMRRLWDAFDIDVSDLLDTYERRARGDALEGIDWMYQKVTRLINSRLRGAEPEQEAAVIDGIARAVTYFATLGDPAVQLVDFDKGGFKILRFRDLERKLRTVDLEASYRKDKSRPEISIHERGNPRNELIAIRAKVENKVGKQGPYQYVRNIIEKGKLLEKLTEYRKASWDSTPNDTEQLDQVTAAPRLTGPGAKAARTRAEPQTDVATLGRERRR